MYLRNTDEYLDPNDDNNEEFVNEMWSNISCFRNEITKLDWTTVLDLRRLVTIRPTREHRCTVPTGSGTPTRTQMA